MEQLILGLCEGRHILPESVSGYIFPQSVNPTDLVEMDKTCHEKLKNCDHLKLYVTGLTVALVTVINYCCRNHIYLILYHFDRESGSYYTQLVLTQVNCDLLNESGYYTAKQINRRCM